MTTVERESRPIVAPAPESAAKHPVLQNNRPELVAGALPAYRSADGLQLWVWCAHESTWHRHGSGCTCEERRELDPCTCPLGTGDSHRGAHCYCVASPYAGTGYVLQEVGPLTAEVLAQHTELPSCGYCEHGNQCGHGTVCPACLSCAEHANADCPSCWSVHAKPGYGWCAEHGIVNGHVHTHPGRCWDDGADGCTFALTTYWPTPRANPEPHVHCPACWAVTTLQRVPGARKGFEQVAPCRGCRQLVGDDLLTTLAVDPVIIGGCWVDPSIYVPDYAAERAKAEAVSADFMASKVPYYAPGEPHCPECGAQLALDLAPSSAAYSCNTCRLLTTHRPARLLEEFARLTAAVAA